MSVKIYLLCLPLALLVVMALPVCAADQPEGSAAAAIDPRAQQMVKAMSDYLTGLNQFSFHASTTMELVTSSDLILNADREADVYVQRPNHVRINSYVPDHDRQIVYNGETLTIYSPKQNVYTVMPAQPTIQQTVESLMAKGVELPLGDFMRSNPYDAIMARARQGTYIGQSLVGGTLCNQVAFRGKDMDWQIWIQDGPTPLPMRVVILDHQVPASPRYMATFTKWDTSPTFAPDLFTFTPPAGAQKVSSISPAIPGTFGKQR